MHQTMQITTQLFHMLQEQSMIELLDKLAEHHEPTWKHSMHVAMYSARIGYDMGLPESSLRNLLIGALLHDIGKLEIPTSILSKPDKLTDKEYQLIQTHPVLGKEIAEQYGYDAPITNIILLHHVNYNHTGYPNWLGDIPIEAQIVRITDTFDAMTMERSYQGPLPSKVVKELLTCYAGTSYNPGILAKLSVL